MVELTIDVDPTLHRELFDWIQKIPPTRDLNLKLTEGAITATVQSPPQLGTLAMAVATYLRTKPAGQRPTVTVTAANGESLDVTSSPSPHDIRRTYIAMDRQPPPVAQQVAEIGAPPVAQPVDEIIDAEIVEEDPPATA